MSNDPSELPSIDLAALREVTGGLADSDGKILEALKGIQDTISELGKNNSGASWEQFLPLLLFAFGGGSGHFYASSGGCTHGAGFRCGRCR